MITDVLRALEADGFDGQFVVRDDSEPRVHVVVAPGRAASEIDVEQVRDLEGARPTPTTCSRWQPSCARRAGRAGTVVLGYGSAASAEARTSSSRVDEVPTPSPGHVEQPHDGAP